MGSLALKLLTFSILFFSITSDATLPAQITVGSYNLYGLRNENEIKKDLSRLPQVDIWAFQEVEGSFTEKTDQKIKSILPEGKWYIVSQKVNPSELKSGAWEGQVIASRFPMDSIDVVPLNHSGEKNRIALVAYFKTQTGENFFFANTDHEVKVFSLDFNDRKKQLLSLVEYFKNTSMKGIITGDFNTTGGKDEIQKTEAVLKGAGFSRALPNKNESYTFEKIFIKTELDHFFSRNIETSKRKRLNQRSGSDHYPIFMDVSL